MPLLLGYVALLDAALAAVAIFRGRVALLMGGALATALLLPLWAISGLGRETLWGPSLAAIAIAVLLNVPARLAGRLAGADEDATRGSRPRASSGCWAWACSPRCWWSRAWASRPACSSRCCWRSWCC